MPKGYWIAHIDVTDKETYKQYVAAIQAPLIRFGARFLVRGTPFILSEGQNKSRTIVIEFPSLEAARACYESEDYQKALKIRLAAAVSDVVVVEGFDGPQPGES